MWKVSAVFLIAEQEEVIDSFCSSQCVAQALHDQFVLMGAELVINEFMGVDYVHDSYLPALLKPQAF